MKHFKNLSNKLVAARIQWQTDIEPLFKVAHSRRSTQINRDRTIPNGGKPLLRHKGNH